MTKRFLTVCSLSALLLTTPVFTEEVVNAKSEEKEALNIEQISEAFGHMIGKNIDALGFDLDIVEVVKGMQNAVAGKAAPMEESECIRAISLVQEEAFNTLAGKNLNEAETFLAENAKLDGVVEVESGKLQYKIEQTGTGTVVESHFSPLVRYTGKFLDGKVFGASTEDEKISLDETIPGFAKGIVGMKEGEKRTLFIHPELGYGTSGYLPPNSCLAFEIEVVKANAPSVEEQAISTTTEVKQNGNNCEVATPLEAGKETQIR